tara:strand:+ start:810 stop:1085 length:276 start_codon:yes stop_codon:yes gene_type:complete
MSRYKNMYTRTDEKTNKKKYTTTLYPEIPERNDDMYFIATDGDRCDNLAIRFYGDAQLWWFIAKVNHLTAMNIVPGTKLRIPISTQDAIGF